MSDPFVVLIADDSPVSWALARRNLAPDQFTVLVTANGLEAVKLYRQHHASLVIANWLLPDLSGPELCAAIRAEAHDRYTYLILLTEPSQKAQVVEGLKAGADDFLTIPFHTDELLARVRAARRLVELHNELAAKNLFLEQLSLTDHLTGIPNRRALEEWASRELHRAARHGYPFWVAMADLDRFKAVNDSYGHSAGDTILKTFAQVLQASARRSDLVSRFGGEEFLLVLTHLNAEQARRAVERIRRQVAAHPFAWNGQEISVTASFGLAGRSEAGNIDLPQLLEEADAALYLAKRKGGNRVESPAQAVATRGES
jgi:two-component system cell cycle response regulator